MHLTPHHWTKRGVVSVHPQSRALSESRKRDLLGCFPSPIFIQRNEKKTNPKPNPPSLNKPVKTRSLNVFTHHQLLGARRRAYYELF